MDNINFDTKRHVDYKDYQGMYENYEETYALVRKIGNLIDHPYLALGLAREVALLYSDLAFGIPITAFASNSETNQAIDKIIEDNQLNQQLSEAALTQAVKGSVILKNYLDNGKSRITFIEPDFYFPVFSPTDKRKLTSETVAYKYQEGNIDYFYTETYEPDANGEYWCFSKTFQHKGNKKADKQLSESKVNTGLYESPLTYVPFIRSGSDFWGDSIYKGSVALYDELNNRVTQISNVLDRHSDPSMWALSSVFDENGNLNHKGGKVYEVQEDAEGRKIGDAPLGYLGFDWHSDANFKFIKEIMFKVLYTVSPLAPALYGLDESSQATGRATLLKSWRTQCKVSRSYMYWRHALKRVLYKAQQLQIISGEASYTPEVPNVELRLNTPIDFFEMAQAEQLKVQSKVTSLKSSIARLNPHYTNKDTEDEYLEMIAEQNEINNLTFMGNTGGTNGA